MEKPFDLECLKSGIRNSDLSNEFLAKEMNMSLSTRMSIAARMLLDSHGNNITEICYSVGFSNVSYFAKCFKEQHG